MKGTAAHIFALAGLILLSGCDGLIAGDRLASCAQSDPLQPVFNPQTGEYSISIDVMTYNVEGLPPELHGDRAKDLGLIKQSFNAMIAKGIVHTPFNWDLFFSADSRTVSSYRT